LQQINLYSLLISSGTNLFFLLVQLVLLTLYFSIKRRKLVNISSELLGWGDVLFCVVACFLFSPVNYLFFYTGSSFLAILLVVAGRLWNKLFFQTIPLAGIQACIVAILLCIQLIYAEIDFTSDSWVYQYVMEG
jgi:hypothetical protein